MENLVGAQRAQKLSRLRITKYCTSMQKALDKGDEVSAVQLEGLLKEYRVRYATAEEAHQSVANLTNDDELDHVLTEAEEYMEERDNVMYQVATKFDTLAKDKEVDRRSVSSNESENSRRASHC